MRRFRYEYGASPLHLLVALAAFAVGGWALARALDVLGDPVNFVVWFLGAILLHDILFVPLYSGLGRIAQGAILRGEESSRLRIAALNHLRIPVMLSALMLLVWFPLILERRAAGFERTTGLTTDVYLERWLGLTAVLLIGSAVLLALRVRRLRAAT